jgi:hypothetical protein
VVLDRIPAGGTAKVLFYITPIQVGHGTASPALVTYKSEEDGSNLQVVNAAGNCFSSIEQKAYKTELH